MQLYCQKRIYFFLMLTISLTGLYAKSTFPNGDFWSLDGGIGISNILVTGSSFQTVIDPKLWLTHKLMAGVKASVNYSLETRTNGNTLSNILTLEGQVYLRWNFLQIRREENRTNIFAQGGIGLIASYRGNKQFWDNVTLTRGSIMGDIAAGITIPLTERWHIKPQLRLGYPHILGASVTAGYKFPLPGGEIKTRTEYIEVIKHMQSGAIIKIIKIAAFN